MERKLPVIIVLLLSVHLSAQIISQTEYSKGITALQQNDISSAEDYFKISTRVNKDAASFYEYGKILVEKNTFESRNLALENLKEAALKEPGNLEYNIAYARFLEQLARKSAKTKYYELIASFPDRPEPLVGLGRLMLEDYYEWKNAKKFRLIDDGNEPEQDYNLSEYVEADYENAEKYLLKALEIAPENVEACFELSRLYINSSNLPRAITYLKTIIKVNPADNAAHLYLGMAYNRMGELNDANAEFSKAIELMNEEERNDFVYGSVVKLLDPKYNLEKKYKSKQEIENFISRFWKVANPLKLSNKNQRLLEHYSRMAYANLHFSLPRHKIIGWKTDRGEVVLRYGIPIIRTKTRPYSPDGIEITAKNEIFEYDQFILSFDDYKMSGNYRLTYEEAKRSNPRSNIYSLGIFEKWKSKKFELYKTRGVKLNLESKLFQFRNLNSIKTKELDSYLVYTLPTDDLAGYADINNSSHEYGIFLYDEELYPLLEKRGNIYSERVKRIIIDERNMERIDNIKFVSPAKPFSFSFEVMKLSDSTYYIYQKEFPAPETGNKGMELSQLVLASAVEENEDIEGAIKRGGMNILPNISGIFRTNQPTYLYYEIYGLDKRPDGLTDFEQIITIQEHEATGSDGTIIGDLINGIRSILSKNNQISLSSSYRTEDENPQQYIQIDLSKYFTGTYDVILTIVDKVSGKTDKKTETIKIWGRKKIE